jgi:hypothetical protein
VFKLILSLWIGSPILAWWPGRMPAAVRKAAACLTLAPVVVGFLFLAHALITRPRQLVWLAGPLLLAFGTMILAGAYSLWPGARPRRNRVAAACLFVGPCLALFALAQVVMYARGGTLTGKVTFKGQPVHSGKVSVMSEDGIVCSGDIRPNGRYVVYRVPRGPVRIAVAAYPPPPPGPVPVPAAPYVAIPPRYRDFDKSRLMRVVTGGGQTQDLDLQP